jgi:ribosomal subunit interface protein
MHITVKGKQIEVGEALRGHVESALTAAVGKYFSNPLESQIVFTREAHLFRADISVHVGRNILIQGQAAAPDAYVAGDQAVEHVAKQLRRHKRKLRDHHVHQKTDDAAAPEPASREDAMVGFEPVVQGQPIVIAEMDAEILTLSVGAAVLRLDQGDRPALLFRHAGHGGLNLVYRRPDGNIGWIDPQGDGAAPGGAARRT